MSKLDANNIKIHPTTMTIQKIMNMDITMPDVSFVGDGDHWQKVCKASEVIENIIIGLPLRPIWLNAEDDSTYTFITELHVIRSIKDFMNNQFEICISQFLPAEYYTTFDKLPRHIQRRIEETVVTVNIIDPGTTEAERQDLIKRLTNVAEIWKG